MRCKEIDLELIQKFPKEMLKEYRLIPFEKKTNSLLFLTDNNPPLTIIDELEVYSKKQLEIKLIPTDELNDLINEYLEAPLETVQGMLTNLESLSLNDFNNLKLDSQVENLEELAQEAPIISFVNVVITTALKKGASDIHIEPFEDEIKLRYRIDGFLYEYLAPPKDLFSAISTRIKIMARLNIAEHRLPQEGRIRIKVLGRELDIRVSFIPTLYGESIVMRLLDRADYLLDIKNLGIESELLDKYLKLINLPHGIILVTGPTGSGKTTTLYATLHYLNSPNKKIITIEDPVEYQLNGINQIQVKPEIGFSFAQGLRSILRQDPDIIMVGEIRDGETAKIAIQAALTGHLVIATLHTNDAVGAITRLINMGVEDFLLAATIRGILAQRLVRVLCPECKESYYPRGNEISDMAIELKPEDRFYHSRGCENCNKIGFKGRTGIYELFTITPKLENIISTGTTKQLREEAKKSGVRSMLDDGFLKAKAGITTIEEVIRVTR